MKYSLIITASAERELKKLPDKETKRIIQRIDSLAFNPRPAGCKKLRGTKDEYRVRSGDYRILYRLEEYSRQVFVHSVGNRKDIYR